MSYKKHVLYVFPLLCVVLSGCATIVKGGDSWSPVQFRAATKYEDPSLDLKVWVDDEPVKPKYEFSSVRGSGNNVDTVTYSPTVDLDADGGKAYDIRVELGGCRANFKVESSISAFWVVADIFVGLGIGLIVDFVTGAWYEFGSDAVILDTTKWMAKHGTPVVENPAIPCGKS